MTTRTQEAMTNGPATGPLADQVHVLTAETQGAAADQPTAPIATGGGR